MTPKLTLLLFTLVVACNAGGGSTGTVADSTADTTANPTTTAADDGFGDGACAVAGVECQSAADCCDGLPPDSGCPTAFPANFTCVSGTCVQGGCVTQQECADLYTGLSCIVIGSRGYCVAACEDDQDCTVDHNMMGTVCIDHSEGDYCREP